jgi:uncharacterized repeat protein (TIGR03803 family)
MKSKILLSLTCALLFFSPAAPLRADRVADRRNERIPVGHRMHVPLHPANKPFDASTPMGNGYTPQQLRHAYGFDQLGTTGAGQIIAIVDAYGSSTIQADLDTFCAQFNIPSTTVMVYFPQGTPGEGPPLSNWATETSLDVEWAHAIAPGATIALVVAQSSSTTDLMAAVDYAVSLGATQISMSWGGPEYSTEGTSDFHFNVPGVTFFASSGDSGAGVNYPACSPYVVGVGGTTLALDSSGNITSETAWSGSGGGPSVYEPIPRYQTGWWSGANRSVPDVAYDADPATGVPVYLTGFGWVQIGGTSMSAPQWAALSALANSLRSQSISLAPGLLYSLANANYSGYFHDIISGSNGAYAAGTGYDLVTGLGSPIANQIVVALAGGFSSQVAAPVFFPAGGAYSNAQNVVIVSPTPGASIRYTIDGSTPTETNGVSYSGPVLISANFTLTAVAYESGLADSPVSSGNYTFLPQAAAPMFSPAGGSYGQAQTVTISSSTPGASIRFTADGSTPTKTIGTLYSGPVSISSTANLQAVAYETGFIDSPVTRDFYTIDPIRVIYNFTGSIDGGFPNGGLVQGSDGNFYGTTNSGGAAGEGTVFKITPTGVLTTMVSFNGDNGNTPTAGLVKSSDGNFYGTTLYGGSGGVGTVFRITPAGVLTPLVSFNNANGSNPWAGLIQGTDGNFYGTTYGGGSGGFGTVFQMTPSGVLTTLFPFGPGGGERPEAGLVQGTDGNFYGTTHAGGSGDLNGGTIFAMTPAGALTTLVSFNGLNGLVPYVADLVQGSDGNFYGTTYGGGSMFQSGVSDGTVFKMNPTGTLTTLVSFSGTNGQYPYAGLVQGSDGNFYGTTINGGGDSDGTIFKITPAGVLISLASFNGVNGEAPYAGLVQGSDGNFYGTTGYGGTSDEGVIFELITQQVAEPTFSLAGGTYTSAQAVSITTSTSGATIRYTTDGSEPSETNGTVYTGTSVPISVSTTLQAIAYEIGFADSNVTTATYNISLPQAVAPAFNPGAGAYDNDQSVSITSATSGASINYTTDGSTPTEMHGIPYGGLVTVNTSTTLQAIAFANGFADSSVSVAPYTMMVAPVVFSPGGGTYTGSQNVVLGTATNGANIRYTTDGSTPSETNGTVYLNAVTISTATTLQAIAYKTGYLDSAGTSATYTINNPGPITLEAESMSPAGTGATISTSVDANASGGVLVFLNSTAAGQTMNLTTPIIPAGTYRVQFRYKTNTSRGQHTVKIDGAQFGGAIDQYAKTQAYLTAALGNVTFSTIGIHNIVLTVTGKNVAATQYYITADSFTFTPVQPQVAAPSFSPAGGNYSTTQIVAITTATGGASIRFTTDGGTPTEANGIVYSIPVNISATTTLKAIGFKSGFTDSIVTSATYTFSPPPTLNFEAESLSYTPTGATASVQTDKNSSGGKWVELAATGTGQYITFTIPSIPAGIYQLKMEWKGNNSRGILQLSVDGSNLGPTLDEYASGETYPIATLGRVTFSSAGNHTVRLTVTGKNKSSSSYQLSADKFTFVGQ